MKSIDKRIENAIKLIYFDKCYWSEMDFTFWQFYLNFYFRNFFSFIFLILSLVITFFLNQLEVYIEIYMNSKNSSTLAIPFITFQENKGF